MKRIIVLLALFVAAPAVAAVINFDRVTTYADGTNILASKVPTIQYRGYYGSSATGPWTSGNVVTDNLVISAPDPAAGGTLWYAVTAILDGQESAKCVPASKSVPVPVPSSPPGCTVR